LGASLFLLNKFKLGSTFLEFEKTYCLGTCPVYKITIDTNGNGLYEGIDFIKKGKKTFKLTENDMNIIVKKLNEIDFFNLKDEYNAMITDLPSTYIEINYNNKHKRIKARAEIPKKLNDFNNFLHNKFMSYI